VTKGNIGWDSLDITMIETAKLKIKVEEQYLKSEWIMRKIHHVIQSKMLPKKRNKPKPMNSQELDIEVD